MVPILSHAGLMLFFHMQLIYVAPVGSSVTPVGVSIGPTLVRLSIHYLTINVFSDCLTRHSTGSLTRQSKPPLEFRSLQ